MEMSNTTLTESASKAIQFYPCLKEESKNINSIDVIKRLLSEGNYLVDELVYFHLLESRSLDGFWRSRFPTSGERSCGAERTSV